VSINTRNLELKLERLHSRLRLDTAAEMKLDVT
jgi:hypothetical protein